MNPQDDTVSKPEIPLSKSSSSKSIVAIKATSSIAASISPILSPEKNHNKMGRTEWVGGGLHLESQEPKQLGGASVERILEPGSNLDENSNRHIVPNTILGTHPDSIWQPRHHRLSGNGRCVHLLLPLHLLLLLMMIQTLEGWQRQWDSQWQHQGRGRDGNLHSGDDRG